MFCILGLLIRSGPIRTSIILASASHINRLVTTTNLQPKKFNLITLSLLSTINSSNYFLFCSLLLLCNPISKVYWEQHKKYMFHYVMWTVDLSLVANITNLVISFCNFRKPLCLSHSAANTRQPILWDKAKLQFNQSTEFLKATPSGGPNVLLWVWWQQRRQVPRRHTCSHLWALWRLSDNWNSWCRNNHRWARNTNICHAFGRNRAWTEAHKLRAREIPWGWKRRKLLWIIRKKQPS